MRILPPIVLKVNNSRRSRNQLNTRNKFERLVHGLVINQTFPILSESYPFHSCWSKDFGFSISGWLGLFPIGPIFSESFTCNISQSKVLLEEHPQLSGYQMVAARTLLLGNLTCSSVQMPRVTPRPDVWSFYFKKKVNLFLASSRRHYT